ncbi:MAG TPA: hypothetical protein VM243_00290 [Phycisphaerae bacterium]|nr:hypothetical protein [Phycisphaerae bacterium]
MRGGTQYARRVKKVYKRARDSVGVPPETAPTDPLEQLVVALLGWDTSAGNAAKAYRKLTEKMADLNEVRVSSLREISAVIREFVPDAPDCARNISRALGAIFHRENGVTLDSIRGKGRREARQYLDSLEGVTPYAAASVQLWSLGGHAIPVDRRLLETLRREELVDPEATPEVVQSFLERNIPASEARDFCHVMSKFASGRVGHSSGKTDGAKKETKSAKRATGGSGGSRTKKRSSNR